MALLLAEVVLADEVEFLIATNARLGVDIAQINVILAALEICDLIALRADLGLRDLVEVKDIAVSAAMEHIVAGATGERVVAVTAP